VDVNTFYDDLSPYGDWVQRGEYGWVWSPHVDAGWRPYSEGQWVYSEFGWTWVADEAWGWAPFHYGRWYEDGELGWLWVPGSEWGPSWVAWQSGGGYVGWAPLPPGTRWAGGIVGRITVDPGAYCFTPVASFTEPRVARYIVPPVRNAVLIRNTVNVTNYRVVNNRILNDSIPTRTIEQATGRAIPRYHVADVRSPAEARAARIAGNQIPLFRPAVRLPQSPAQLPAPRARAVVSTQELDRQHQAEQQQLSARHDAERRALQDLHQREQNDARAAHNADLARQHQDEARALDQRQQQQRQQAETRYRAQQQRAAAQEQRRPPERSAPRERPAPPERTPPEQRPPV
jgi:hypothetical protein